MISLSGRKRSEVSILDWIQFELGHLKEHSNSSFTLDEIDTVFGVVEEYSPLYGGRVSHPLLQEPNLTRYDVYSLYNNGIGVKLTLSSTLFTELLYQSTVKLLNKYHRVGNSVVVSTTELCMRIREDFPKYKIELSVVSDISDTRKLIKNNIDLYDTIVLPMAQNDDIAFLESITNKDQIRLFVNVECSYNCPKKMCYTSTSKINAGIQPRDEPMLCSSWTHKLARTFYRDDVNFEDFYFDIDNFKRMGFSKFKMISPVANQQRIELMRSDIYENR